MLQSGEIGDIFEQSRCCLRVQILGCEKQDPVAIACLNKEQ